MPRPALRLAAALALALACAVPDARAEDGAAAREDVVALRFAWPAPARAKVTFRRTRSRAGERPGTFTARYELAAEPAEGGLSVATRATSWRGDLPVPPALAKEAIRASERVAQRIRAQGEFAGLEGADALRPVLARVLDDARVPPEQAERAVALALAAARTDAEELWNVAVGFWTGADLRLGETYALESEAEVPLLPGVRALQAVQFGVRRRVPCAAAERVARCVEAVLRSSPDRAALERAAPALLARLFPAGAPSGATAPGVELSAERTLVLVTDPATLLPRRVVWTRAVRLSGGERGGPEAELVDRAEWDYRWLPPAPPSRPVLRRAPPPAAGYLPPPPA